MALNQYNQPMKSCQTTFLKRKSLTYIILIIFHSFILFYFMYLSWPCARLLFFLNNAKLVMSHWTKTVLEECQLCFYPGLWAWLSSLVKLCDRGCSEVGGRKRHVDSVPPCSSRAAIMWQRRHNGSNQYGQYWHG